MKSRNFNTTEFSFIEHIEPEKLNSVLAHLRGLTLRVAFLYISTQPAHKKLADGRNAHLIVQPAKWWMEQLRIHGSVVRSAFVRSNEDGAADVSIWLDVSA